jgi:hypothetical protein
MKVQALTQTHRPRVIQRVALVTLTAEAPHCVATYAILTNVWKLHTFIDVYVIHKANHTQYYESCTRENAAFIAVNVQPMLKFTYHTWLLCCITELLEFL